MKRACPHVHITRVLLIDNPSLQDRFAAHHTLMKSTLSGTGYQRVDYKQRSKNLLDTELSKQLKELPGVRGVLTAFSGVVEKGAFKFARRGMVNRKRDGDKGFFGSGLYLTPQAVYAAKYCTDLSPGGPQERTRRAHACDGLVLGRQRLPDHARD